MLPLGEGEADVDWEKVQQNFPESGNVLYMDMSDGKNSLSCALKIYSRYSVYVIP